ncbi:MAG: ABC transporter substrate-binding protein [Acidimicrobiales bacterium]|nr:ABC transporter substrate-binding protein [Acidimicrobiales bacterium]
MRNRRLAVLMTVLALVAAACGGDRGEDTSTPSTTDAPSDTTEDTESDGDEPGPGDYGTLTDVCGPNEGGGTLPDLGDDELLGITEDSIEVGTVSDPGYEQRPGLNQEIFDAATAFVEWCNQAGGINGKTLTLNLHDAAILEYQPVVEEACRTDFALVGAGAVQDNLWPDVGAACGLIDIAGFSVTPQKAGFVGEDLIANRSVQAIPNASDQVGVGANRLLQEEFPEAAQATGFIYGDLQTLVTVYERYAEGWENAGHTVVHAEPYNSIAGESNWQPFVIGLQDDGVEFLNFVGEGQNLALLQRAMAEVGYSPEVTLQETNFYDEEYLAAAGDAADGTFIRSVLWPFFEADENPATQRYIDTVEAIDGKIATLGAQSTSAWLLFAQAVKECDLANELSRSCVLETAAAVSDWDAGGLHAPTNPSENVASECVVVLQVVEGEFTRWAPDDGYYCDEENVVDIGRTAE